MAKRKTRNKLPVLCDLSQSVPVCFNSDNFHSHWYPEIRNDGGRAAFEPFLAHEQFSQGMHLANGKAIRHQNGEKGTCDR